MATVGSPSRYSFQLPNLAADGWRSPLEETTFDWPKTNAVPDIVVGGENPASAHLSVTDTIDRKFGSQSNRSSLSLPSSNGGGSAGEGLDLSSPAAMAELQKYLAAAEGQSRDHYESLSAFSVPADDDMDIDWTGSDNSGFGFAGAPGSPASSFTREQDWDMTSHDDETEKDRFFRNTGSTGHTLTVDGLEASVTLGGATFSAEDAYHLRHIMCQTRASDGLVRKALHYCASAKFWEQFKADNATTPFLHFAKASAADQDLANGFRALHRLFSADISPFQAIRIVMNCPSAADLSSVNLSHLPIDDQIAHLKQLKQGLAPATPALPLSPLTPRTQSFVNFLAAPLSPGLQSPRGADPSAYQYPASATPIAFAHFLGRNDITDADVPVMILSWILLAHHTFSPKSFVQEDEVAEPASPGVGGQSSVFTTACKRVLTEMFHVTQDFRKSTDGFVNGNVNLDELWHQWVGTFPPWTGYN